jgi:hypothetical protein
MPPPEVVAEVNQRTILMLCDGRARAGWAIVVVWPEDGGRFELIELPPDCPAAVPGGVALDVLMPGSMLSGFDNAWTVLTQQAPGDADFPG